MTHKLAACVHVTQHFADDKPGKGSRYVGRRIADIVHEAV
jgi:hypothetical protein